MDISDLESFYNAIVENSGYAIITGTTEGIITSFNKAAEELLGYSAEEVVGNQTPAIFHLQEEIEQRAKEFSHTLNTRVEIGFDVFIAKARLGLPNKHEWTYVKKDGTLFPVMLSVTALKGKNSNDIIGYMGIAVDISDLKLIEKKLRDSEKQLQSAQNIAHIGNWWLNFATGKLHWSDEIYRIFGRSPGEFEPSYERFFETVHPDDVEAIKKSEEIAFSQHLPHSIDHRIILPDGEIRWVHEEAVPSYDEQGEMVFLSGTVQDITERTMLVSALKNSEKRFRDILENLTDWVWEIDVDGNFSFASISVEAVLGYTQEEILNMNAFDLMPEEEVPRVNKVYAQIISEKRAFKDMLNINLHKDGTHLTILSSGVPIFDPKGELIGYRGTDKDVTEKIKLENELEQQRHALEELNQSLNSLVEKRTMELKDALKKIEALKEKEKENIYHATVYGAQHILNNLLNQLTLVKIEIDKHASFNKEVAGQFDTMTKQAQQLVVQLSSVQEMEEEKIKDSVYPK